MSGEEKWAKVAESLIAYLTPAELKVYCWLDRHQGADARFAVRKPISWFADCLGLSPNTVRKALDGLERRQLIKREDLTPDQSVSPAGGRAQTARLVTVVVNPAREGMDADTVDWFSDPVVVERDARIEARKRAKKARGRKRWGLDGDEAAGANAHQNLKSGCAKTDERSNLGAHQELSSAPRSSDVGGRSDEAVPADAFTDTEVEAELEARLDSLARGLTVPPPEEVAL